MDKSCDTISFHDSGISDSDGKDVSRHHLTQLTDDVDTFHLSFPKLLVVYGVWISF